jgi:hypothetical protein
MIKVVSQWELKRDKLLRCYGTVLWEGREYMLLDWPSITVPYAHCVPVDAEPDQDGMMEMTTLELGYNCAADMLDWGDKRLIGRCMIHVIYR